MREAMELARLGLQGGEELLQFSRTLSRPFLWVVLVVAMVSLSLSTGRYYSAPLGGPSVFVSILLFTLLQGAFTAAVALLWGSLIHFALAPRRHPGEQEGDYPLDHVGDHWGVTPRETVLLVFLSALPMLFYAPLAVLAGLISPALEGLLVTALLAAWCFYIFTHSLAALYKIKARQALRIEIKTALLICFFPLLLFIFLVANLGVGRVFA